jgi:hypothetical protein
MSAPQLTFAQVAYQDSLKAQQIGFGSTQQRFLLAQQQLLIDIQAGSIAEGSTICKCGCNRIVSPVVSVQPTAVKKVKVYREKHYLDCNGVLQYRTQESELRSM